MDTEYHLHKQRLATLRQDTQRWQLSKLAQAKPAAGTRRITRIRHIVLQIAAALRLIE
jgi:hypothetical protein